ncbi:MAG TPA: hypothetical protein VEX68_24940 [Bryobacteraceae bacterium]|nr:hypothetical protein [Bryobacteraceae bacterium]
MKTGAHEPCSWTLQFASGCARDAGGSTGIGCLASCLAGGRAFQQAIYELHLDGITCSRLGRRKGIGAATVERYFQHGLGR